MTLSAAVLVAILKCLWKGLAMHMKGVMNGKQVVSLANADKQPLQELQELLTWLSKGPSSWSAQEADEGITAAGSVFSRLLA